MSTEAEKNVQHQEEVVSMELPAPPGWKKQVGGANDALINCLVPSYSYFQRLTMCRSPVKNLLCLIDGFITFDNKEFQLTGTRGSNLDGQNRSNYILKLLRMTTYSRTQFGCTHCGFLAALFLGNLNPYESCQGDYSPSCPAIPVWEGGENNLMRTKYYAKEYCN